MEEYAPGLCKNCRHFKGIIPSGSYTKLACAKFSFRTMANAQQLDSFPELKVGCYEAKKEELVELKPEFHGIKINLKELFRRLFRKHG